MILTTEFRVTGELFNTVFIQKYSTTERNGMLVFGTYKQLHSFLWVPMTQTPCHRVSKKVKIGLRISVNNHFKRHRVGLWMRRGKVKIVPWMFAKNHSFLFVIKNESGFEDVSI
ncbi:hypothetical protein CEXT_201431 [Caerostris extrusa]|uniref:Uncharacterized protein n=1 Tax=Caerostris extrusa TaxID=172846 RepID=A0AAV4NXU6_CAEEX|nr:hypothetical protein CEXT_201431 [Caerostris extrusa]